MENISVSETKTTAAPEKNGDYIPAVGRRKSASARIRLFPAGKGALTINDQDWKAYFPTVAMQETIMAPLKAVGREDGVDVTVKVVGGGKRGQSEAVQLGIARALVALDAELRKSLKSLGLLSRDARVKERKKPGRHKARRAHQWSKR